MCIRMEWNYIFVILQVLAGRDGKMLLKNMGVWNFLLISLETIRVGGSLKLPSQKRKLINQLKEIDFENDFYKSKYTEENSTI